jgi:hypothetical protein
MGSSVNKNPGVVVPGLLLRVRAWKKKTLGVVVPPGSWCRRGYCFAGRSASRQAQNSGARWFRRPALVVVVVYHAFEDRDSRQRDRHRRSSFVA